jgi:uncharacterized NAD(P)/FAD-binding protein YdhS
MRATVTTGRGWREAVDALRAISNDIWQELPLADRKRFLRHLKTYWEPLRHRMAPEIRVQLDEYQASGVLEIIAGRVQEVSSRDHEVQVRILPKRGAERVLKVDRIISCTGIQESYVDHPRPLIGALIEKGLAQANDLGIGFRTDSHGALLDVKRKPSSVFFTLGPPRRGELFETTAVPEIRVQAKELARLLVRLSSTGPLEPVNN